MFGIRYIGKCPHCNKLYFGDIGVTDVYTYHQNNVIIEHHKNCPTFITTFESFNPPLDRYRNTIGRKMIPYVVNTTIKYILQEQNEDDIIHNTIDELSKNENFKHLNENINDIKTVIQIILGSTHINWSTQLTTDVEHDLKHACTACF